MQMLDPRLQALFKAAQDVDIPILFHLAPFVDDNYGLADLPGLPGLEETLRKFPKLKVFGHSQAFWCEIGKYRGQHVRFGYPTGPVDEGRIPQLMRKYPNLYGDLSAGSGCNALMRDRAYAAKFLTEFQDRLFFATDICSPEMARKKPHDLGALLRDMAAKGEISQEVFEKVAAGNARRVLGV
jgi:predicted TIM-barrel fold metal-dependent hydrolase